MASLVPLRGRTSPASLARALDVRRREQVIMKCPKCDSEMVDGKAHIGGGTMTALTGGMSLANLTFTGTGWREHVIQETSDVLPAHYCDGCGALTVESKRRGLSALES
jgi:hypothetical protein